ncbi:unnamed protein product [Meloidogyne enterolobii]|uniref:Uncharacterized protein n=1 Tax=Meloidogyne enterolobii TaxID=390850 RepID=A0ACB1A7A3_MELEN
MYPFYYCLAELCLHFVHEPHRILTCTPQQPPILNTPFPNVWEVHTSILLKLFSQSYFQTNFFDLFFDKTMRDGTALFFLMFLLIFSINEKE